MKIIWELTLLKNTGWTYYLAVVLPYNNSQLYIESHSFLGLKLILNGSYLWYKCSSNILSALCILPILKSLLPDLLYGSSFFRSWYVFVLIFKRKQLRRILGEMFCDLLADEVIIFPSPLGKIFGWTMYGFTKYGLVIVPLYILCLVME